MSPKQAILVVLIFLFLLSCSKESTSPHKKNYETIYPLDYLPAYPGSWWKYVDRNGDTSIIETEPDYQLDYYVLAATGYKSDTFWVPVYDNTLLWEYDVHSGPIAHAASWVFQKVLSDTLPVGSYWWIRYGPYTNILREIVAKDCTISISSTPYFPTIVIDEFVDAIGIHMRYRRFYTKNIGMIREDSYRQSAQFPHNDTINGSREITEYHIKN